MAKPSAKSTQIRRAEAGMRATPVPPSVRAWLRQNGRKYLWLVPLPCAVWLFFAFQGMFHYLPTRPQIDLEVYRFGVQAWWSGHDMYGTLPRVENGAELPFVYPPFAALILSPLAMLPWDASVVTVYI